MTKKLVTIPNKRKTNEPITLEWLYSNTLEFEAPEESALKTPCRIWQGSLTKMGYASLSIGRIGRVGHKVAYELRHGKVGDDLVLDHLCRTRSCIETTHLEPVPGKVNTRRGLACLNGAPCRRCGGSRFASTKQRKCLDCQSANRRKWKKPDHNIYRQKDEGSECSL